MTWVAIAMGGVSLGGAALSSQGSQSAAATQAAAQTQAANTQVGMFNTIKRQENPFIQSGYSADAALNYLMGLKPTGYSTPNVKPAVDPNSLPGAPNTTTHAKAQAEHALMGVLSGGNPLAAVFGTNIPGLRYGGNTPSGRDVIVGEEGPEVLHMAPGSQGYVTPNPTTLSRMMLPGRGTGGFVGGGEGGNWTGISEGDPAPWKGMLGGNTPSIPGGPVAPVTPGGPAAPVMGGHPANPAAPVNPSNGFLSQGPGGLPAGYLTQRFDPKNLQNYPGYQFQLQQGQEALQNSQSASIGALSGPALKQLMQFNQGLAANNYSNYFNQFQTQQNNIFDRLSSLAQLGQNAASGVGGSGTKLGTGIAQAQAAAGGSLAGGQLGAANAYAGAANNIPLYMLMANGGMGGSTP